VCVIKNSEKWCVGVCTLFVYVFLIIKPKGQKLIKKDKRRI
jgi:hypothetical protein